MSRHRRRQGERRPESSGDGGPGASSRREVPRTTPSQAEGDDLEHEDAADNGEDGAEDSEASTSG
ncbi:hypothetical protein [Streptomyces sp. 11x1]|uniref:hypothetical protein n=1 Tax=Streptomyces sp. 11x1 TaxID=3038642 RepID=UPI00292E720A|nr:hypothetical protein [Streptomyces sp. 11x1]WNZ06554.1 hypothetical protein P8T65_02425 [Streptomyces sp. 11x1]